jgi:hypothetical protein
VGQAAPVRTGKAARFDLRALSLAAFLLCSLAVILVAQLWYDTTLGDPFDGLLSFGLPGGGFTPVLAGFGIWLCWFARRISRANHLPGRLATAAFVLGLIAASAWAAWVAAYLLGRLPWFQAS